MIRISDSLPFATWSSIPSVTRDPRALPDLLWERVSRTADSEMSKQAQRDFLSAAVLSRLQPLSLEGQSGLNAFAGVSSLELRQRF